MHLPRFEHIRATSLEEASKLLNEYGPSARLVAGGTDLLPRMKYGLSRSDVVVSLKGIPAGRPSVTSDGDLRLDALMTLADMARSAEVQERVPGLKEAALSVGSNQIRHMGTLGGNLCQENRCLYYNQTHLFQFVEPCFKRQGDRCYSIPKGKKCWAIFASDTAPALISLRASMEITGFKGKRRIPLEDLYTGDPLKPLDLSHDEVIAMVQVPAPSQRAGMAFVKLTGRGGLEFGALSVAVSLEIDPNADTCKSARIILGAIGPKPIRAKKAETAMAGQPLSPDLFQEVARMVASEVNPVLHHGYSSGYLKYVMEVYTQRTLDRASESITQ